MSMLVQRGGVWWDGDFALLSFDSFTQTAVFVKDLGDEWEIRTDYYGGEQTITHNAEFEKASHGQKMGDYVRFASVPNLLVEQHELDEKMRQGDSKAIDRFFAEHSKLKTHRGNFS